MAAETPRAGLTAVTMVVPAFNEADTLPRTMPRFVSFVRERGWNLIVVNDCSTDATPEILEPFEDDDRVTVLHHKVNRGYGGALKTGIAAATSPFVVTVDADGQHQLTDIDALYAECDRRDADMVVGNRGRHRRVCSARSARS